MKQLLEAIRAKYLCLHDWEVVSKTEYTDCWKNVRSVVNLEKGEYERSLYPYN